MQTQTTRCGPNLNGFGPMILSAKKHLVGMRVVRPATVTPGRTDLSRDRLEGFKTLPVLRIGPKE